MFHPIFTNNPFTRWASRLVLACCLLPAATPVVAAEEKNEGIRLYQNQQYSEAAPLLKRAAIKGNARAQAALGLMYMEGLGVAQNYRKAKKWFEKAARRGPRRRANLPGHAVQPRTRRRTGLHQSPDMV